MEYINHIGKYTDSQAVVDALEAGTLASPYVVQIDGNIYYNYYPEPDACANWEEGGYESYEDCRCQQYGEDCPEQTMGTWSYDGECYYTFEITETDQSYWNDTYIGTINSIDYAGTTDDAEILLTPGADAGSWDMKIHQENGSETIVETFEEGTDYMWDDSGFMVDESDSNSTLSVYWDGYGTFTFSSDPENPISMTTIDPPYPEAAGE